MTLDTAHENKAMSSQVEAAGRELARYGLVVVVGWIVWRTRIKTSLSIVSASPPTLPAKSRPLVESGHLGEPFMTRATAPPRPDRPDAGSFTPMIGRCGRTGAGRC